MWPLKFTFLLWLLNSFVSGFPKRQQDNAVLLSGLGVNFFCAPYQRFTYYEINSCAYEGCQKLHKHFGSTTLLYLLSKIKPSIPSVSKYSGDNFDEPSPGSILYKIRILLVHSKKMQKKAHFYAVFSYNSKNFACSSKGVEMVETETKISKCREEESF
ncbi:hypothetical protein GcM3_069025 [Golovinomyces cichoracearum]|uniref:Secreted effector protein n=1 Tax=Golovinomyces cichoracearum TaxID=62708 RepID=A0A420ITB3_9PEZI|nr:hypothetical protein GcM3_069025 [Golovinomyces cichoracearum]